MSGWGQPEMPAGAVGNLLMVFDSDGVEGRLQLNGLRSDGIEFELDMSIPTPG